MKKIALAGLISAIAAFAWWSLPGVPRPPSEQAAAGHAGGDPAALVDGVVVSIDKSAGNVTLSHGPLPNLGMQGMTMGFRVGDPALLADIKPGDKVKFRADVVGGAFTVVSMERAN